MKTKYSGKIIKVVEEEVKLPNGKAKTYEYAMRSPGVRALIVKDNKMLISKEYRHELNAYDYRLPGGKVFDTLEEYTNHLNDDMAKFAKMAVVKECYEEVGIITKTPKLLQISKAGATVVWDLFYYEITNFKLDKQHLEDGEIINYEWFTFDEVKAMCLNNKITEDRSVGIILKYLLNKQ